MSTMESLLLLSPLPNPNREGPELTHSVDITIIQEGLIDYWGIAARCIPFLWRSERSMLKKGIEETPLFVTFEPLIQAVGLRLVDVSIFESRGHVGVNLVIMAQSRTTTVDDCATVHKIVAPKLNLFYESREVSLEVSTPGLQRNLKDVYELTLYIGKRIRIYSTIIKGWLSGIIESTEETSLTLSDVFVDDTKEQLERKSVEFDEIQKAKLDYRWEDTPHGN